MEYAYKKNNQHYVLTCDGKFVGAPLNEVAIAFTAPIDEGDTFILHKHGSVDSVEQWASSQREKLKKSGLSTWSNEIVVISGQFDIDLLNRILSNSGYLPKFLGHHHIDVKAMQSQSPLLDYEISDDHDVIDGMAGPAL